MLSGSIGEYWKRNDGHAQASKVFFALGLCLCGLMLLWPTVGLVCAFASILVSLGLSMNEWKRK